MIIDLGCGEEKIPGAVGLDNVSLPGVDVVHDLMDFPYPFENESADEIYLNHVIEHFLLPDIQKILMEIHRILKSSGILHIRVPHVYSVAAWIDPTHRMAFAFDTISFFDVNSRKAYYKETVNNWRHVATTTLVNWFNWKKYRIRKINELLSRMIEKVLDWLLRKEDFPGSADLVVKLIPIFFVEIQWRLQKK